jgi:hypothetical protein
MSFSEWVFLMVESKEKQILVAIVAGYLELVRWKFLASSCDVYIGLHMHSMH